MSHLHQIKIPVTVAIAAGRLDIPANAMKLGLVTKHPEAIGRRSIMFITNKSGLESLRALTAQAREKDREKLVRESCKTVVERIDRLLLSIPEPIGGEK